jgi:hypothetical protein
MNSKSSQTAMSDNPALELLGLVEKCVAKCKRDLECIPSPGATYESKQKAIRADIDKAWTSLVPAPSVSSVLWKRQVLTIKQSVEEYYLQKQTLERQFTASAIEEEQEYNRQCMAAVEKMYGNVIRTARPNWAQDLTRILARATASNQQAMSVSKRTADQAALDEAEDSLLNDSDEERTADISESVRNATAEISDPNSGGTNPPVARYDGEESANGPRRKPFRLSRRVQVSKKSVHKHNT